MPFQEDLDTARFLLRKADDMLREEGVDAALVAFRSALDHCRNASLSREEIEARFGLARCLEQLRRIPESIVEFEVAARLAESLEEPGSVFHATSHLGALYMSQGQWEQALASASRTRDLSRGAGDRRNEVAAVGLIGQIHRRQGDLQASLDAAMDGLALAQEIGDIDEELAFFADMALVSLRQESHQQAEELAAKGLTRAREHGRAAHVPVFLGQLCQAVRAQGDLTAARGYAEEGLAAARAVENEKEQAVFLQDLAMILEAEERFPEAIETFQESLDLLGALANREGLVLGYRRMALLLCLAGEDVRGFAALAHSLTLAFPVSPQLFQETFSAIFQTAAIPWGRGAFENLLAGLDQIHQAMTFFEEQGRDEEVGAVNALQEVVEVLALMTESRGDPDAEAGVEALERAGAVDAELGCDLRGYVRAGFRLFTER